MRFAACSEGGTPFFVLERELGAVWRTERGGMERQWRTLARAVPRTLKPHTECGGTPEPQP